MSNSISLTGVERHFHPDEVIVSKTDLKGRITYANRTFLDIAGYAENEVLGQPHSIIRHPDMPRSVFKLLWNTIESGQEIFAYVVNRAKNGDHYWVYAHVTPSYDLSGNLVGFHSMRRSPCDSVIKESVVPLYQAIKAKEDAFSNRKDGMAAGVSMVVDMLKGMGVSYEEFIAELSEPERCVA